MEIGISGGLQPRGGLEGLIADVRSAAEAGIQTYWFAQIVQQVEAMNLIGVVAQQVPGIRFGTAVVPTYPRHPMVMAEQALTTSLLTGGRFTLGIGLSHKPVVEGMWGISFDKPVRHLREYLDALMPLVNGETARAKGETIVARGKLEIPGAVSPPVLVAALGPQMLKLAGARCDGTVTWMTGADTLRSFTVPTLKEAAAGAGRPDPTIAAGFPIWVTDDVVGVRDIAARTFEIYGQLPSYRAMLDREGLDGPADLAVIGDEETCGRRLEELADAGVTHFTGAVFATSAEDRDRTRAFLASRV